VNLDNSNLITCATEESECYQKTRRSFDRKADSLASSSW
jgi:hypothetical protein